MDQDLFRRELQAAGFEQITTVTREPNGFLDTHTHPFEAKALILSGEITLVCGGREQRYQPGEVFHLALAEPHTERYGPQGVSYLVGRK
ncbi:MAG: cupin [Burkholderiales bacterium]|nr:cupin [Burkholderiales bacterium]MCZ8293391.1 cupin [Hylemonella sp.]